MVNLYRPKQLIDSLPKTAITAGDIKVLLTAKDYLHELLALIDSATTRIYFTVLYLENDEAGQLVVQHLIAAKQRCPQMDIKIFVDFHRARRGLYGQEDDCGNAGFYREIDEKHPDFMNFYGVAVKQREVFGVLHLKGLVIDETLLYTGASINNIYLHTQERYRYDRYCVINSTTLSDSFVDYLNSALLPSEGVYLFNRQPLKIDNKFKKKVATQHKKLSKSKYELQGCNDQAICITPLIGLGKRHNQLNKVIHQQILKTQEKMVIYTPYFNLPGILKRDINRLLRRGVSIEIVVGDKHASDFYIPEDQPFSKIGLIPYLYETTLRTFVKRHQKDIDNGLLIIRLWRHDSNSYHLKGIKIDDRFHLLTGNNLNPRAWRLDLENGLLIDDKQGQLAEMFEHEHQTVIEHTTEIKDWQQIEGADSYPPLVQKWLTRFRRTNLDKLFKQYM
ncbi:MAG: CDP-diacylglycerol--serine O-phosphatidyltransferase [Psychrobium sp.]|nr:CDP-diacylglycerol--serine O-phosphatidyltransferase [Psychrobium sp.]